MGGIEQEVFGVRNAGCRCGQVVGLTGNAHQDGGNASGCTSECGDTHIINRSGYLSLIGLSVNEATSSRKVPHSFLNLYFNE